MHHVQDDHCTLSSFHIFCFDFGYERVKTALNKTNFSLIRESNKQHPVQCFLLCLGHKHKTTGVIIIKLPHFLLNPAGNINTLISKRVNYSQVFPSCVVTLLLFTQLINYARKHSEPAFLHNYVVFTLANNQSKDTITLINNCFYQFCNISGFTLYFFNLI